MIILFWRRSFGLITCSFLFFFASFFFFFLGGGWGSGVIVSGVFIDSLRNWRVIVKKACIDGSSPFTDQKPTILPDQRRIRAYPPSCKRKHGPSNRQNPPNPHTQQPETRPLTCCPLLTSPQKPGAEHQQERGDDGQGPSPQQQEPGLGKPERMLKPRRTDHYRTSAYEILQTKPVSFGHSLALVSQVSTGFCFTPCEYTHWVLTPFSHISV